MATALHSRNLKTTDLEDQYHSAGEQLEASRKAASMGLREDREIYGDCLGLTFYGPAHAITRLVELLHHNGIYITQATGADDAEHKVLQSHIQDLTYVCEGVL